MRAENDQLKKFYEETYERSTAIPQIPDNDDFVYAQVLRQVGPYLAPQLRVLDLGCNDGNVSLYMGKIGCDVIGIDLAQNAVDLATRGAESHGMKNVQFCAMDFASDWAEPERFDLVLCTHVLEHVLEEKQFLAKIRASLKPNGMLILSVPTVHSSLYRLNMIIRGRFPFDEEVGHLRRYSKNSLLTLLTDAGFVANKSVYMDSALREWFFLNEKLRRFNRVWSLPGVRKVFNSLDLFLAHFFFPATLCIHAHAI